MYSRIAGTGSYLPEQIVTNFDLEKKMDTTDEWIRTRTGIERRHIAADGQTTVDIGEFAAQTRLRLRPYFLEQHSAADDGLARDWPRPDTGVEKHESYSLQWYSFAALAVVLFVVLSFRRVAQN